MAPKDQSHSLPHDGQTTEHAHQLHPSNNDLVILRHLSSLPGGFDQPHLLPQRFNAFTNHPGAVQPSDQLRALFDSGKCDRKHLWSFVLGIPSQSTAADGQDWKALPPHRDERQVELDVNRSFVYYPTNITGAQKQYLRRRLDRTIISVLRRFPKLNYFQGYHDVASIFLLNFIDFERRAREEAEQVKTEDEREENDKEQEDPLDEEGALLDQVVQRFTLHRIRDSMTNDLSPIMGYLRFTQAILTREQPKLASLIAQTSNLPLFSLSWILTLTSHDLTSFDTVSRLFDFLLSHEPIMICYLACAICLTKTDDVRRLAADAAAEGGEIDLDMVHFVMAKLPVLTMGTEEEQASKPGSANPTDVEAEEVQASKPGSANPTDVEAEEEQASKPGSVNPTDAEAEDDPRSQPGPESQPSMREKETLLGDNGVEPEEEHKPSVAAQVSEESTPPDPSEKPEDVVDGDFDRPEKDPECSEPPSGPKAAKSLRRKDEISIETVIGSALGLYERYPPTDTRLRLDAILGPQSCVYSWARSRAGVLGDLQAEEILDRPLREIVRPDPADVELKKRQKALRRRALLRRKIRELVSGPNAIILGSVVVGLIAWRLSRKDQGGCCWWWWGPRIEGGWMGPIDELFKAVWF